MIKEEKLIVQCGRCRKYYYVPKNRGRLILTCHSCKNRWEFFTGNKISYKIINLEQRTEEWLSWRNNGIGASDAPIIMGENPWKTSEQLMNEKISGLSQPSNAAMIRGISLEPEARRYYETQIGIHVYPVCLQSIKYEWLRASVDGLSKDGSLVVEIKCGEKVYRQSASTRQVPNYYYGQLQHILAVTNLKTIDFWCYLPCRPSVHLSVDRNENYIKTLLNTEYEFWNNILNYR